MVIIDPGRSDLRALLLLDMSRELVVDLLRAIETAYRRAETRCGEFEKPERRDLMGYERRACVEDAVYHWSKRHVEVSCETVPNGNGSTFFRVASTGRILFSSAHVDSPSTFVNQSVFRQDLELGQHNLFSPSDMTGSGSPAQTYFVLLHGPHPDDPGRPGFVQLAIPIHAQKDYLANFDLYKLYSIPLGAWTATKPESIQDQVLPGIRENLSTQSEREA